MKELPQLLEQLGKETYSVVVVVSGNNLHVRENASNL